jgi:hypothetical protein
MPIREEGGEGERRGRSKGGGREKMS